RAYPRAQLFVAGLLPRQRPRDLITLRLRLVLRHAIFQPSDHHQKVARPVAASAKKPGGRPDFDSAWKLELRRRDPHNRIGFAIKLDRLADYAVVAAEPPAPQPVADDGDSRAVRVVVRRQEESPA